MARYDSILGTVGNTPVVRINRLAPDHVNLFVKIEAFNPMVSVKDRLDALLAPIAGKPIVTVSDIPGFLDRGGMIQFVLVDNRVRFSISLDPVNRSQVALSSELLKVAVTVNGKPGGGTR